MSAANAGATAQGNDYIEMLIRAELDEASTITTDAIVLNAVELAARNRLKIEQDIANSRYDILRQRRKLKPRYA